MPVDAMRVAWALGMHRSLGVIRRARERLGAVEDVTVEAHLRGLDDLRAVDRGRHQGLDDWRRTPTHRPG